MQVHKVSCNKCRVDLVKSEEGSPLDPLDLHNWVLNVYFGIVIA